MATATLRPDATVSNGGSTVTGAATRHEALADTGGSSYVRLDLGQGRDPVSPPVTLTGRH